MMQKTIITLLCAAGMIISNTAAAETLRVRPGAQIPLPPVEMARIMGCKPFQNQKPQPDLSRAGFGLNVCKRQAAFEHR